MNSLTVYKRTNSDNNHFLYLVKELDNYLTGINGEDDSFFRQFNSMDKLQNVIVVYFNEIPIACGAFKMHNKTTIEVKRMYVKHECRGKGIATGILNELETWGKELGYKAAILETSNVMNDALTLYKKNGYIVVPNYGQYKDVESSVCFEKELS